MRRSMAEPRSSLAPRPNGRSSNHKPPQDRDRRRFSRPGSRASTAGSAFLDGRGHFLANDGKLQQLILQSAVFRPLGAVAEACRLYPPIRHILHEVPPRRKGRIENAIIPPRCIVPKKRRVRCRRRSSLWREEEERCTLKEQHLTLSTGRGSR